MGSTLHLRSTKFRRVESKHFHGKGKCRSKNRIFFSGPQTFIFEMIRLKFTREMNIFFYKWTAVAWQIANSCKKFAVCIRLSRSAAPPAICDRPCVRQQQSFPFPTNRSLIFQQKIKIKRTHMLNAWTARHAARCHLWMAPDSGLILCPRIVLIDHFTKLLSAFARNGQTEKAQISMLETIELYASTEEDSKIHVGKWSRQPPPSTLSLLLCVTPPQITTTVVAVSILMRDLCCERPSYSAGGFEQLAMPCAKGSLHCDQVSLGGQLRFHTY